MRLGAARRGLLIVGAVLLVPWIWIEITAPVPAVRDDDESLVFAPLTTIPLRSIGSSAIATIEIPRNPSWKRVRQAWGDPGYLIAAVSDPERIECFESLGIHVQATTGPTASIQLHGEQIPPYGYSTECRTTTGLAFNAAPGTMITLHISAEPAHKPRSGTLIVVAYWRGNIKDRIVRVDLDKWFRRIFARIALFGAALISITLLLFVIRSRKAD